MSPVMPEIGVELRLLPLWQVENRLDAVPDVTSILVMMMTGCRCTIHDAPQVKTQLRPIDRKFYSLTRRTIEEQLAVEPDIETTNRKPLTRPVEFGATWELRFGGQNKFRVLYEIDPERRRVKILAIGVKHGNRLTIGTEEVEL